MINCVYVCVLCVCMCADNRHQPYRTAEAGHETGTAGRPAPKPSVAGSRHGECGGPTVSEVGGDGQRGHRFLGLLSQ